MLSKRSFSLLAATPFILSYVGNVQTQVLAQPKGVKTIHSPGGATIRYKEPGKEGICETTPGVNLVLWICRSGRKDAHVLLVLGSWE